MKKSGRPPLDEAERIRRRIWFDSVMSKSTMTLYDMDCKFDLNFKSRVSRKTSDSRRRKLFEDLRDKDIMPFRGHEAKFVYRVESEPGFQNTAFLYTSYFWDFVRKKPLSLLEIRSLIFKILDSYSLFSKQENFDDTNETETEIAVYIKNHETLMGFTQFQLQRSLLLVINHITSDLDKLALIGALFREAYMAGNLHNAVFLENVFNSYRDAFANSSHVHLSLKDDFIDLCNSRLLTQYIVKKPEVKYAEMLNSSANPKSAGAMLLNRQDRFCW